MKISELNFATVVGIQLRRSSMRNVDQEFYYQSLVTMLEPFRGNSVDKVLLSTINEHIDSLKLDPTTRDCCLYVAQFFDDWREGRKSLPSNGVHMDCPYCNGRAHLKHSSEVYEDRDFGMLYLCDNYPQACDAYVGVHQGDYLPLGQLSNTQLRGLRRSVHRLIDPLWRERAYSRNVVYGFLAQVMDLPILECHVAMFDDEACKKVLAMRPKLLEEFVN
jgi:hypothetical protein